MTIMMKAMARVFRLSRQMLAVALTLVAAAGNAPVTSLAADCRFGPGLAELRQMVGADVVGDCLGDEQASDNGDGRQATSKGELVRRKADGRVVFTNGYETWLVGPDGLARRLNADRFPWESEAQAPPPAPSAAPRTVAVPTEGPLIEPAAAPPSPAAVAAPLPSRPSVVADLILDGPPEIGGGLQLGGLSGLAALDGAATSFVSVTDRGPNKDLRVRGDKAVSFLVPTYAPSIVKLRVEQGQLRVAERIPLRLARGSDSITGTSEVSGLPNGSRDEPAYDGDGRQALGIDPNGVDTEGIAVDPRDGTYWICEEYGPSILHVAADGTILTRLIPEGLALGGVGYDLKPVLPAILTRRKPNRGFEGIAMSSDGRTVFGLMQSPLSNPDKATGEASRNIRLVAVDVSGEPRTVGMYVYRSEAYDAVGAREQDDVKLGDLAALSATALLVTERDSGPAGAHRKVYRIELDGATDLTARVLPGKGLEAMSESDLARAKITPVAKRLVVDLAGLGFGHELVEGLAIVDPTTIAVINDNNFEPAERTELMLVRLPSPLR